MLRGYHPPKIPEHNLQIYAGVDGLEECLDAAPSRRLSMSRTSRSFSTWLHGVMEESLHSSGQWLMLGLWKHSAIETNEFELGEDSESVPGEPMSSYLMLAWLRKRLR